MTEVNHYSILEYKEKLFHYQSALRLFDATNLAHDLSRLRRF